MSRRVAKTSAKMPAETAKPRSLQARLAPYVIPHTLALSVPIGGLAAHAAWGGQPVATALVSLAMAGGTTGLSALAHKIGRVREQIVRWHTTTTVALAGAGATGTMIVGLNPTWLQIAGGVGLLTGFSWNLRRLDSLRQGDGASPAEQDSWARQLGLEGIKPGKAKQIGARLEVPLQHGVGTTVKTAQAALPAIEAAAGVVPGRSRVVENPDDASRSTLVLVTEDVLKSTIPWSGPSSPGGCITEPLIFAVYEDDIPLELRLCGPGVIASHLLWMGMSGAGKTIAALGFVTEVLTRRNAVVEWFDASKGEQSVGPIKHAFARYENTVAGGHQMMRDLKEEVKDRANRMGAAGFDSWEPACFDHPDLRLPLKVVHFEEASELVADSKTFVWLTEKARSVGIIISVSLQRATATSMPTDARFNIGTALCFGVGDDYSASFALSDATIAAGAHPEKWGNRKSGYFYVEAPGLDETRFAVPLRACLPDKKQLVEAVNAYAAPRTQRTTSTAIAVTSTNVEEDELDEQIPDQPDADLVAGMDPSQPIAAYTGPDLAFGSAKPKAESKAQAEAAFDEVLIALANEGKKEIRVKDIVERLKVRSDTWTSRRLSAVAEGVETVPPGIALERGDEAGAYRLHVLAGAGA